MIRFRSQLLELLARRAIRPALLVALTLVGAACGGEGADGGAATGEGDGGGGSDAPPPAPAEPRPVEVLLDEYSIDMPRTLAAGPTVFQVQNVGFEEHDFILAVAGTIVTELQPVLNPGAQGRLVYDLAPGEYLAYCSVSSHEGRGMSMQVTVTGEGP